MTPNALSAPGASWFASALKMQLKSRPTQAINVWLIMIYIGGLNTSQCTLLAYKKLNKLRKDLTECSFGRSCVFYLGYVSMVIFTEGHFDGWVVMFGIWTILDMDIFCHATIFTYKKDTGFHVHQEGK